MTPWRWWLVISEWIMNKSLSSFARHYAANLRRYLADEREAGLAQAYELGRRAIAQGLGVLDMARIHQQAVGASLPPFSTGANTRRNLKAAETFFLESLSPFEATHRGFRETNGRLQQAIATLEKRNLDLGRMNRELELEINERKRTEKALRESEEHFRELFKQARRMEESLRNLSNQVLHVQEEERKRISRELHDEVGQALTAISMNLQALKNNGASKSPPMMRKLADTQTLLQETMETVHRFARELRPSMLDELGLLPALRSQMKAFAERTGIEVRFRANAIAENLDSEQKTVVFRIAQESLTNVAKHAQASQVEVTIRKLGKSICMEVADNGKSFREDAQTSAKTGKRLGLLGMQERVRLVNGKFAVHPHPGRGTTVRVEIPLKSASVLMAVRRTSNRPDGSQRFFHNALTSPAPPRLLITQTNRSYYGKDQSIVG
jgi:signal transduction histidine kinase